MTSRDTGRWIIPKGWQIRGVADSEAACVEAWEEAGVKGKVRSNPLGTYRYLKDREFPTVVQVYLLRVTAEEKRWPEAGQRRRKWFSASKAAKIASDKGLRRIIRRLT